MIHIPAVKGEQDRDKEVDDQHNNLKQEDRLAGQQQYLFKPGVIIEIIHDKLGPEKHRKRHRDKVQHGVRINESYPVLLIQKAPEDIGDVIGNQRIQKRTVRRMRGHVRPVVVPA